LSKTTACYGLWQVRYPAGKFMEVVMKHLLASVALALGSFSSSWAALDVGERAPNFTAQAALAGKVFTFSLAESLAKGPVVLYFFPLAFSEDCSIEAHEFAEATAKFKDLGATVVGVSADGIDTLTRFSKQVCQSRFAVASDEAMNIIKSYDAVWRARPEFANRVSYVIAPNGSVIYNYVSLNPQRHVEKTLGALREWITAKTGK
jgi:peroxiredoxin